MPRVYSVELRERAIAQVDGGASISAVAERLKISPDTIDNWLRLRKVTGSLAPALRGPLGLDDAQREVLRGLAEAHPAARQQDLADMLTESSGAYVDQTTIGRELRKMGFVRKKVAAPRRVSPEAPTGKPGGYRSPAGARERRHYPSDLTDAQWELIAPFIPPPKPGGRPVEHTRRTIVDAILYVSRTGCQWRALPHDFPPWSTVYDLFSQWRDEGVWERVNTALRERCRTKLGREPTPSAAVIDSQVAKTTEKGGSGDTTAASASRVASGTSSSTSRGSCSPPGSSPPTSRTRRPRFAS